jgi:hypothetical protein
MRSLIRRGSAQPGSRPEKRAPKHDPPGRTAGRGGEQFERTAASGGRIALARAAARVAYRGHCKSVLTGWRCASRAGPVECQRTPRFGPRYRRRSTRQNGRLPRFVSEVRRAISSLLARPSWKGPTRLEDNARRHGAWSREGRLYVRKPALDLSDVVRQRGKFGTALERIGGTVGGFAWPRRAVKPQRRMAARRRRGA